jgi:hypothetical protein
VLIKRAMLDDNPSRNTSTSKLRRKLDSLASVKRNAKDKLSTTRQTSKEKLLDSASGGNGSGGSGSGSGVKKEKVARRSSKDKLLATVTKRRSRDLDEE